MIGQYQKMLSKSTNHAREDNIFQSRPSSNVVILSVDHMLRIEKEGFGL